jgi:hypothetical protein
MPFNIERFKNNIEQYGYVKNNHFQIAIRPPNVINNNVAVDMIRFRADSIKLPGITILTADNQRYGVGPTQKQPHAANFSENSISMICDKEGELWRFWYEWSRRIFQFNGAENQIPGYYTEYKDNYSTTVQISVYDPNGYLIQTFNLFEAFPTSIQETNMNWGNSELIRLNVGLTYASYNLV